MRTLKVSFQILLFLILIILKIAREAEVEGAQKRVKSLQKEISGLRAKLDAKTGYEKIIDLENKLKETDMKYSELQKELKGLEQIEKNQEKELEKLRQSQEPNGKLKDLNDQLKAAKDKNKDLEKKIQADASSYQKQHVSLIDVQEKLQKLKEEKIQWKRAIAEGVPTPYEEKTADTGKKTEEEMLKYSIKSLKKRIEFERASSKKQVDLLKTELSQLQLQIKEAEQESKLNAAKLKELKPMLRHNQLKPLKTDGAAAAAATVPAEDGPEAVPSADTHATAAAALEKEDKGGEGSAALDLSGAEAPIVSSTGPAGEVPDLNLSADGKQA